MTAVNATPTVELTRFRVDRRQAEALRAARTAMLEDFRADRAGFIDAQLVRLPNDEWLDIVWWQSAEDLAASRAKGANRPGIKAFFDAIDALITTETGVGTEARSGGGA
jgi:quinol monooxygenase YgiN